MAAAARRQSIRDGHISTAATYDQLAAGIERTHRLRTGDLSD